MRELDAPPLPETGVKGSGWDCSTIGGTQEDKRKGKEEKKEETEGW